MLTRPLCLASFTAQTKESCCCCCCCWFSPLCHVFCCPLSSFSWELSANTNHQPFFARESSSMSIPPLSAHLHAESSAMQWRGHFTCLLSADFLPPPCVRSKRAISNLKFAHSARSAQPWEFFYYNERLGTGTFDNENGRSV